MRKHLKTTSTSNLLQSFDESFEVITVSCIVSLCYYNGSTLTDFDSLCVVLTSRTETASLHDHHRRRDTQLRRRPGHRSGLLRVLEVGPGHVSGCPVPRAAPRAGWAPPSAGSQTIYIKSFSRCFCPKRRTRERTVKLRAIETKCNNKYYFT